MRFMRFARGSFVVCDAVFVLMASALCIWFICVAPVRGGSYFLCSRKESNQRKRLQPPVPAGINQQHMAFEPSGRMRSTSDQGRSRTLVANSEWGYWVIWAHPFVLRACYGVSRVWRDGSED